MSWTLLHFSYGAGDGGGGDGGGGDGVVVGVSRAS